MAARVKRAEKRMTCCLLLLLSLFFWPVNLPGVQAADSSSAEVKDPSGDEELQEGRIFRSQRSLPRKILAAPRHLLFPLKYPVKKFMIFSERVDLMTRVQDVLYFNDERTAGWFPKVSAGGKTSLALGASIFYDDMFAQSRQWRFSLAFGDGEEWAARGIAEAPEFLGPKWRPALKVWAEEKGEEDRLLSRSIHRLQDVCAYINLRLYKKGQIFICPRLSAWIGLLRLASNYAASLVGRFAATLGGAFFLAGAFFTPTGLFAFLGAAFLAAGFFATFLVTLATTGTFLLCFFKQKNFISNQINKPNNTTTETSFNIVNSLVSGLKAASSDIICLLNEVSSITSESTEVVMPLAAPVMLTPGNKKKAKTTIITNAEISSLFI